MSLKEKLRNWLDQRWNYEIQCDVFDGLNRDEIDEIARKYDIDISLSRLEICQKLAKILQAKKEEYEIVLKESGCANTMDPISGTDIEDIDSRELLKISQGGQQYCFEIDGIYKNVFINNNPKNPYTNVPFDEDSLKFIEAEYEKFKILKGKKFDKYAYASDTNLSAVVNQLSNYLPYTVGIDRFLRANRQQINNFLYILLENYDVAIPSGWGILPEVVDISVEEDIKLREYKIQIVQELIRWIVKNDYMNVREAWLDTFQEENMNFGLETESLLAVYNNDIDELQRLVDVGADLTVTDSNGLSLLHTALKNNSNTQIVKFLIENGVYIDYKDQEGNTAIIYGIENNSYDNVKFLIEEGASLYTTNNSQESPLYIASKKGNKDMITLLLDTLEVIDDNNLKGIIINILNLNDVSLVELLFDKDIDIDISLDDEQNTPLMYSLKQKLKPGIIDTLLKNGSSLNKTSLLL